MFGTLRVREEHDLVHLRGRVRAAADGLGLRGRAEALPSAAFDLARALRSQAGDVLVTFRLLPAHLEIALEATAPDAVAARQYAASLHALQVSLTPSLHQDGTLVRAVIRCALPAMTDPVIALAALAGPASADGTDSPSFDRMTLDLRQELDHTHRGVVALHAELDELAERLRQSEERFELLLAQVQDYALCTLDPDGTIVGWNAGAERLFGHTAQEILGSHVGTFYGTEERALGVPAEQLAAARDTGRFECECLRVRKDGSTFDAHALLTSVRTGDGGLRGYLLVVRDTTARRRLEGDLQRRADDLASANRAKEEFLATLSHELRTPLNAMLGWTRLLRMGRLEGPAMDKALETIERNAHIQEQLIADILDVSRVVTGKLRLVPRPMELSMVVEAGLDAVRPAAEAKGVQLLTDVSTPGPVLGDPDRLQQVVWNLLANAIKFTPSGGRIRTTVSRQGPDAVITVTDTGEGIAPELLPFVFDRFRQGDASATRPHGGLGLGLSLVRHIVELHGGHVQARSAGLGRGATMSVHLPVRAIQEPVAAGDPVATPLAGLSVLVVDDDPDAREVVALALTQYGARTVAAAGAREGLAALAETRPDVVVSDIGMPEEDGCSFIRRVRQLPDASLAATPAVALTGFVHVEARRRALESGYQQFVAKPVQIEELAAVIRELTARSRS